MSGMVIFQPEAGDSVSVRLDGETLWLTQDQMAELFGRERSVITKHLRNIFRNKELAESSVCANFAHTAADGKSYRTLHYNLDAIISVGYRVNSKRGTQFRQWATRVLRDHLTQGWTLDRARMQRNAAELEAALVLVRKTAQTPELTADTGRGLVEIVSRYTQTFLLLQRYDEGLLNEPNGTPGGTLPTPDEARRALLTLKVDLMARGEAGDLFGRERDDGLASILGNLDQTVFGQPAYATVESKAAHLLYFVIKDHPLSDGNKRSGAFLFVDFLHRNGALLREGQLVINDIGLAALALLVAESAPAQKETMIRLVENMLAGPL
ncbi:MAG: virulence protein RhuM/Fic/DOC family protein [Paludibacterium sp.]|uniref:virulence protein RhuM/Fic/DOC family protein n=1 Tax=Paludibacterium sp. TaxID=1917523 RepID=UPI0025D0F2DD|nr:virulence protein RhuM/Fic/DOC family protein [Paludibacterium sp.]MBV8048836.1 virulence protein RhuM/Fic/DOC family protein [Paludibacterium sp.]MBV8646507.1 virulence protein RhuM/Fic/DOC family protein [Paludibacterium sp.]